MSTTTEELQVVLTGDVANFAASMKAATGALNTIAAGMQRAEKAAAKVQSGIEKFTAAMTRAGEKAEMIGKQFKKLGSVGMEIGGALSAAFAGAFLGGAAYDQGVADQLKELKDIAGNLAAEVATALMPAARELAAWLRNLLGWVQGLNPELKENIAHYAVMALEIAGVVAVLGRVGGVVDDVAEFFTRMIVPLLPFAGIILGVAAAVGVLFVAAGLLREAWDTNLGGIQEKFAAVWSWIVEKVTAVGKAFKDVARNIFGWFSEAFTKVKGAVVNALIAIIDTMARAAKALGMGDLADDMAGFAKDVVHWLDYITTENGLADLADQARISWDFAAAGIKKNLASIKGMLPGFGGKAGSVRGLLSEGGVDVGFAAKHDGRGDYRDDLGLRRGVESARDVDERRRREIEAAKNPVDTGSYLGLQDAIARNAAALSEALSNGNTEMAHHLELAAIDLGQQLDGSVAAFGREIRGRFISAAGRAGQMANSAMQGFQAAGPWGAVISVVADMVLSLKATAKALANASKGIRMITAFLDELFGDFGPALELLLRVSVIPMFMVIKSIVVPIKALSLGIMVFGNWLSQLVEDITALVQVRAPNKVQMFDTTAAQKDFEKWADLDMDAIFNRISAEVDAADAVGDFGHAVSAVSESLTNVPQTFKIAAARFAAQDAGGGGGMGGYHSASPVETGGMGRSGTIVINIEGDVVGSIPEDLLEQIERQLGRKRFTRSGVTGRIK